MKTITNLLQKHFDSTARQGSILANDLDNKKITQEEFNRRHAYMLGELHATEHCQYIIEHIDKRQLIMDTLRDEDIHEILTSEDTLEIFLNILHGAGDITADTLTMLCENYNTSLEDVLTHNINNQ